MIIFKTSGEELYRDDATDIKQTVQAAIAKKIDLSYANLVNTDLSELNLTGAILSHADLRSVNFNNCIFDCADLSNANANSAIFSDCIITNCQFVRTNLINAYFSKSRIKDSSFKQSKALQSNFTDCVLMGVNFKQANLSGSKLCSKYPPTGAASFFQRDQTLRQPTPEEINRGAGTEGIYKSNFQEAQLCAATFKNQLLIQNNWIGANCISTNFYKAMIDYSDMRQTDLKYSIFDFAKLKAVNFNKNTLVEVSFQAAEFQNLSAKKTLFEECYFTGVKLTECDLASLPVEPDAVEDEDEQGKNCTIFSRCKLPVSIFENVSMSHAKFIECDLRATLFLGSVVTHTRFEKSNLLCSTFKAVKKPYDLCFSGCSLLYAKFYTPNMKISVVSSDFRNADLSTTIDVQHGEHASNFQGTILDPAHAGNPDFAPSNQPLWDYSFPGQPLAVPVPVDPLASSNFDENSDISSEPDADKSMS